MKCPACASTESTVIRSKVTPGGVRRTRQCDECAKRWVTIEAPRAPDAPDPHEQAEVLAQHREGR